MNDKAKLMQLKTAILNEMAALKSREEVLKNQLKAVNKDLDEIYKGKQGEFF
jgi:hypothetical protein